VLISRVLSSEIRKYFFTKVQKHKLASRIPAHVTSIMGIGEDNCQELSFYRDCQNEERNVKSGSVIVC
jgi:hypothetical protein